MPLKLLLVGLSAMVLPTRSNPPLPHPHPHCLEYGGCRYPPHPQPHVYHHPHQNPFVPAPPGKTPSCAKHGQTFCEKVDRYPMHLIRYLTEHWVYDYTTLLSDESRNDLKVKPKSVKGGYGPPPQFGPYPPALYPPPPLAGNSINFTQGEGYPDRRYPLVTNPFLGVAEDPGLLYSAVLQPDVTPYEPAHWWKRHARARRQAQSPETTQLCPTRGQFVSPRAALNSEGNWMFVVNLDQDQNSFTQQVRAETCVSDQCSGLCSLPSGYSSRCQQQYVQKRLIALQGSGSQLYTDTFWLPHCCVCQISFNV